MWWKVDFPGSFYVGLSIIMVALVTWTADYGGLITRPATPFNSRASHEVALAEHVHGSHLKGSEPSIDDLQKELGSAITVSDVIPIFKEHNCQKCHAHNFSDGKPMNFFQDIDPNSVFLQKDAAGKLVNIESSNFYQTVIVENMMPKGPKGKSVGLSPSERLTLLLWLRNGAPMELTTP
jgi:hypothetical protein